MPTRAKIELPEQIQRLVRAKVLKTAHLPPKQLAMLKRLSAAEVSALISMRRKFRGTIRGRGDICWFIPL
jgi:hypothetical protein